VSSVLEPGDVIYDQAALHALLQGPNGPVARDLARRAVAVESQAKINATQRPGPRVDTGRLRSSISWRLGEDAQGLYAERCPVPVPRPGARSSVQDLTHERKDSRARLR
jgi:hypothetical protein